MPRCQKIQLPCYLRIATTVSSSHRHAPALEVVVDDGQFDHLPERFDVEVDTQTTLVHVGRAGAPPVGKPLVRIAFEHDLFRIDDHHPGVMRLHRACQNFRSSGKGVPLPVSRYCFKLRRKYAHLALRWAMNSVGSRQ